MDHENEEDKQEEELEELPASEAREKVGEEKPGKGKSEEKEVKEEEEIEEDEEVSYPDTDELSISRMFGIGLRTLLITFLLTSVLYVLATTGIGNLAWQGPAQGNLVEHNDEVVGSRLIGQPFSSDKYFHPRPSSKNYDGMDSGSANLSPGNEKLARRSTELLERLEEEGVKPEEVPVSLVTESGSSLDPHIVPKSAYLQVPRVSEATGIDPERLRELIDDNTQNKFVGLYGLERVNVLSLNIEIEKILESG
ncbi:MAG: K(+)-transporting ATPase subunit C [Candidatus Bipolaricaulota bacterium]|nr:K(+)-transporting ATPase subunit C [Candidatus Bipolaricaulota bacterium]MBS3792697.1 K(+)-transporting ATPase subunit C [Candidatus Bipolaricaulota bacterium]